MHEQTPAERDRDIIITVLCGTSATAENTGAVDLLCLAFELLQAEAEAVTGALPEGYERSLGYALQGRIDALASFVLWHCDLKLLPHGERSAES